LQIERVEFRRAVQLNECDVRAIARRDADKFSHGNELDTGVEASRRPL
jgi:hypothetical protein